MTTPKKEYRIPTEACDRYDAMLTAGCIIANGWVREHEGRYFACALAALSPGVADLRVALECPGDWMPSWLAHRVIQINDKGRKQEQEQLNSDGALIRLDLARSAVRTLEATHDATYARQLRRLRRGVFVGEVAFHTPAAAAFDAVLCVSDSALRNDKATASYAAWSYLNGGLLGDLESAIV